MATTGKARVLQAIRGEEVDRIPWVPFVGVHAGALLEKSATEFLQSEDLMVEGVQEAIRRYQPDGIPVAFDLQIEAETFGCALNWADDNPPAVTSHPLADGGKTLDDLRVPSADDGRVGLVLNAGRRLREANPDIALYGLITGPFTLALHLMGTEIFMRMFDDPDGIKQVLLFCQRVGEAMAKYYVEIGCDVIAVVDPMTSQIGPDQFREFVTPFATPLFQSIRDQGVLGSFFVCGHAQQNIEAMCECKPDNISVDENIPLDYVRDVARQHDISYGGNMQLTSVLLLGSERESQRNALACMEIGKGGGFILAPGCDLPFATPPENLAAVTKLATDPYEQDVVRSLVEEEVAPEMTLDMSEYGQSNKVIVDVITLDSESCAPCQYMVEAVRSVSPEFEGIVEWREHKIKYKESLVFMSSLMVRNIPTICIDGKITFVSRIPKRDELIAAIQQRIYEKLRMKISRKRGSFLILGDGGEECQAVKANVDKAVAEMGADMSTELVTDPDQYIQYGIAPVQTPAVVMINYEVKNAKTVPEVPVVKEWIKQIL